MLSITNSMRRSCGSCRDRRFPSCNLHWMSACRTGFAPVPYPLLWDRCLLRHLENSVPSQSELLCEHPDLRGGHWRTPPVPAKQMPGLTQRVSDTRLRPPQKSRHLRHRPPVDVYELKHLLLSFAQTIAISLQKPAPMTGGLGCAPAILEVVPENVDSHVDLFREQNSQTTPSSQAPHTHVGYTRFGCSGQAIALFTDGACIGFQ